MVILIQNLPLPATLSHPLATLIPGRLTDHLPFAVEIKYVMKIFNIQKYFFSQKGKNV